jgi:transposase InsO family protein
MDVKKIGRIPDGGGWKAHGRGAASISRDRATKVGFDYVHSLVDDHSRLAYSEVLPDEKGATCAGFLTRAAGYFAAHGISRIQRIMTDNAWAYRWSLREVVAALGAKQVFIKPHCPWQNGKVEWPEPHPGDRMGLPAGLHQQRRPHRRPCPLARALQHSATPQRSGRPASDQPAVTNLMAGYI